MTTITESVRRMAIAGTRPCDIARALGTTINTVDGMLCRLRRKGEPIPDFRRLRADGIPPKKYAGVLKAIDAEAMNRGVSREDLIAKILTAVTEDNLFAAVIGNHDRAPLHDHLNQRRAY
ncbi:hypothetical protein CHELA1G11_13020 [Hyphomicrobiales bacterium]|nr:conserved hypothetical protein [Hyphomicrobiales bacterium]CAH1668744.1 hypothetical protein CHELA1G11_13020 [Hyphomicrobiales bacterium]